MQDDVHLDFETFSEAPFGKKRDAVTAAAYAEHPSTEVLCFAWQIPSEMYRPKLWVPGMSFPHRLVGHVVNGGRIFAWNVGFERFIWEYCLMRMRGVAGKVPAVQPEQWRDVMAAAAYYSLPQSLDEFARVTGLPHQKDMEGHKAMQKLSKPRKPTKKDPSTRWTFENAQEDYNKLYSYCPQDVTTEVAAAEMLKDAPCLQ